jgi:hypothetical protein
LVTHKNYIRERIRQSKPTKTYQKHSCTGPSGAMGRRRDGNHTAQKNNSMQDSVGNEENGYPVPDLNKTMINVIRIQVTPT